MQQSKTINITTSTDKGSELESKAASLEKISKLSEKSLKFLSGLNVEKADKKLSNFLLQTVIKQKIEE